MENKFYTCIGRNWMLFLELLKYFPKLCEKHLSSVKNKDLNAVWTEATYMSMDGKRIFSAPICGTVYS